jgi:hypothetical protein
MPFAAPFETQDKQGKQALRKDSKATAKTTSSPAKSLKPGEMISERPILPARDGNCFQPQAIQQQSHRGSSLLIYHVRSMARMVGGR